MPRYNTEVVPPAAFVQVQVTNPTTGASRWLSAKLDTGASMSVIPDAVVEALSLPPRSEARFYAFDGSSSVRHLFHIDLEMEGHRMALLEVTSSSRQDMLLGRDVLNQFIITFNGKDLTFEIMDP
jgi:predicted aspartyl protease